jgi:uroporphyrinogen decarboxylase
VEFFINNLSYNLSIGSERERIMKNTLTPRQRISLALEHKQPDRVPIGYVTTPEAKDLLMNYLDIHSDDELLKRLGVDYRFITPGYTGPKELLFEDCWDIPGKDIWGVDRKNISNAFGTYREISGYPLEDIKDVKELESYPWPDVEWLDFSTLQDQIDRLEEEDEYWIILNVMGGSIFEMAWYMRRMENLMVDLLVNPEIALKIMEKLYEFTTGAIDRAFKATGGRIDMILFADDVASQEGMLMSRDTWQKMIKPWHQKFYKKAHGYGAKTVYHSCGSIEPIINDLIEIGLDLLNPLQFSAKGFPEPGDLKYKYGDRLSFLGGMDIQTILPFYSPEEIKKETLKLIDILGKDGGYILQSTHHIQPDSPPENVMAMYDTALQYRY